MNTQVSVTTGRARTLTARPLGWLSLAPRWLSHLHHAGYGSSDKNSQPSEGGCYAAADAAFDYVTNVTTSSAAPRFFSRNSHLIENTTVLPLD